MVAPALYMANGYGCSLLLLFYYLSNIPIQNRFVLATGLAEQLTIRCFANPLWFKDVISHQFAKRVDFDVLYFHQHAINFCSLMLFFFICCISVISWF